MSPRRSSRARSSQQPSVPSQAVSSSSSSTTLKEITNTLPLASSSATNLARASVQRSLSTDDLASSARPDMAQPRRSRRGVETEKETPVQPTSDEDDENDGVGEDEVTRCICGYVDYPGPSASIRDQLNPAAITDDLGNFFVQCDNCHVWQHGGCLGLTDDSMLPDEYYCEKCRPEYHKIIKASHLPKSSRYLPVLESGSHTLVRPPTEQPRLKESKNKILQSTKRRATMNSRGAYDEDELLQRAIEESRHQGQSSETLGKRSRDESDDGQRAAHKRQRTAGSNSDPSLKSESPDPAVDSTRLGKNGTKLRGAAARNNREKELREKQKQEAAAHKAEAASKRNARSERRRVDDSPPPSPSLSPSKAAAKAKHDPTSATKTTSKKLNNGKPGSKGKRLGRNQYTRDRDIDVSDTPLRDTSHDRATGSPRMNGELGTKSSRAKTHPARTSLNEMKKRVAAILEFVGMMQTHATGSSVRGNSHGSSSRSSNGKGGSTPSHKVVTNGVHVPTSGLVQALSASLVDLSPNGKMEFLQGEEFAKMGSKDMMDALTKELVQWQTAFGVYSR